MVGDDWCGGTCKMAAWIKPAGAQDMMQTLLHVKAHLILAFAQKKNRNG
jgi:hypothetical protein